MIYVIGGLQSLLNSFGGNVEPSVLGDLYKILISHYMQIAKLKKGGGEGVFLECIFYLGLVHSACLPFHYNYFFHTVVLLVTSLIFNVSDLDIKSIVSEGS